VDWSNTIKLSTNENINTQTVYKLIHSEIVPLNGIWIPNNNKRKLKYCTADTILTKLFTWH